MLIKTVLILLLYTVSLFATEPLKSNYYVKNNYVTLCDIDRKAKECTKIFNIPESRHSKRIKTTQLLTLLQTFGYKKLKSKHSYTQFTQKSPIDIKSLKLFIEKSYQNAYKNIEIQNTEVNPRSFLLQLPKEFTIVLSKKNYLKAKGVLYIQTAKKKRIFFNYFVYANVSIFKTKKRIAKGELLSNVNLKKESIILDKFRAMPLQEIQESLYQAKHTLRENDIVTSRDITGVYLVKRGARVQVKMHDSNIEISFSATAKQNGRYGEMISIISTNGKKMRAKVISRNRVEIE